MRTRLVLLFVVCMALGGCVAKKMDDGTTKFNLLPEWGKKLDQAEQAGEGILGLLTVLSPLFGPAGGIAVGGLATGLTILKKARPKLKDAQDRHQLANTVAAITVDALDQIKKDHPKVWEKTAIKLQKECEESGVDTKLVKNVIRGLRGLPPKV